MWTWIRKCFWADVPAGLWSASLRHGFVGCLKVGPPLSTVIIVIVIKYHLLEQDHLHFKRIISSYDPTISEQPCRHSVFPCSDLSAETAAKEHCYDAQFFAQFALIVWYSFCHTWVQCVQDLLWWKCQLSGPDHQRSWYWPGFVHTRAKLRFSYFLMEI